jgi:diguanylate cyclase (GGDEF)-like protein
MMAGGVANEDRMDGPASSLLSALAPPLPDRDRDDLTGLLSRTAIIDELSRRLFNETEGIAVLYLDLDDFKDINDGYGHKAGDAVLTEIADRILQMVRRGDAVGRVGGDEFLIISTSGAGDDALALSGRIVEAIRHPIRLGAVEIHPRVSGGLALSLDGQLTTDQLIANADLALHEAKRSKLSVALANVGVRRRMQARLAIERDLTRAMQDGSLCLHYQPIRRLASGQFLGAEALLRWDHPDFGPLSPPLIIERIEATNRTEEFTAWAWETIARQWSQFRESSEAFANACVTVNSSARQLMLPNLADIAGRALIRNSLPAQAVAIEITESDELSERAELTIQELHDAGYDMMIDDFGVGYNALEYVSRLPIAALKLDRSLVSSVAENEAARIIVEGIIGIGQRLNMVILAEGIENEDEAGIFKHLGATHGQGYHLGKPMPLERLAKLERSGHHWRPVLNHRSVE